MIRTGITYCDVFAVGPASWGHVHLLGGITGRTIVCEIDGVERWRQTVPQSLGTLRAACDGRGRVLAIGHGQDDRCWVVEDGGPARPDGLIYGTESAAVRGLEVGWLTVVQTSRTAYRVNHDTIDLPSDLHGTSTGIAEITVTGQVRWNDRLERDKPVPGMRWPHEDAGVIVGQRAGGLSDALLLRDVDGRTVTVTHGLCYEPHLAALRDGRVAVCARMAHGAYIGVLSRPFVSVSEPPIQALGHKAFVGGFYATTDRYPQTISDYPQNVEVIVEPSAISRATTPVIAAPDALSGVTDPARVIGLYVAAEEAGTASALDLAAELARARWRVLFGSRPVPAVVGYVTRGMAARATWPPRSVDVFAPEIYFDTTPSVAALQALMAGWEHVLSAVRPWLIVGQAYDRGGVQRDQMGALAAVTPAYLELLRARRWILGVLWFAVNRQGGAGPTREGGVAVYPELLEQHRRIFAAVPAAPATLPVPIAPTDDTMKIHVDDYDRTGRVGERARILFRLESDVPVVKARIDFENDGLPGLELAGEDLRDLAGVVVRPKRAGRLNWKMSAEDANGDPDETGAPRPIEVQE